MKHRGMYWSPKGAYSMARMIVLETLDSLYELFYGSWRDEYKKFKDSKLSAGHLVNHFPPKASEAFRSSNDKVRFLH